MSGRFRYEWTVEHLNADGDITNSDFAETLDGVLPFTKWPDTDTVATHVGLVKNVHDRVSDDLVDRTWAYIDGGALPSEFEDGTKTPMSARDVVQRRAAAGVYLGGAR